MVRVKTILLSQMLYSSLHYSSENQMFSTKFSPCKSEKINDLSRNGNLQTGFNQAGSDSAGLAII